MYNLTESKNFFFFNMVPPDVFQKFISHYRLLNFKHIRGDPVEKKKIKKKSFSISSNLVYQIGSNFNKE